MEGVLYHSFSILEQYRGFTIFKSKDKEVYRLVKYGNNNTNEIEKIYKTVKSCKKFINKYLKPEEKKTMIKNIDALVNTADKKVLKEPKAKKGNVGRPKVKRDVRNKQISSYLSIKEYESLEKVAEEQGLTVSQFLRKITLEKIKE